MSWLDDMELADPAYRKALIDDEGAVPGVPEDDHPAQGRADPRPRDDTQVVYRVVAASG